MRSGTVGRLVAGVVAILCVCAVAAGDFLTLQDGRVLTGRLISQDDKTVVFEMHKFGSKIVMTLPASSVKSLIKGEVKPDKTGSKQPPQTGQTKDRPGAAA